MKTTWSKPDSVSSVNMTPAAPEIAAHHPLHASRQRDVRVHESLVHPIGDRAVVVERRENFAYRLNNIIQATDIKKCFLLTGKGRIRQVLGRRRRAHGERDAGRVAGQLGIRRPDLGFKRRRAAVPA